MLCVHTEQGTRFTGQPARSSERWSPFHLRSTAQEMEQLLGSGGDSRNPSLPADASPGPWSLTATDGHVQAHTS